MEKCKEVYPSKGPLKGKRILITRPVEQSAELAVLISALGGEPVKFPVISVAPPDSWDSADYAIENLHDYNWVIFTSVNGVNSFMERITELGKDISYAFYDVKICTVGVKTADAVEPYGVHVDFVPAEFRAEAIVKGFKGMAGIGKKILIPRAQVGRELLPDELIKMGMNVDVVPVYKVVKPDTDATILKDMLSKKEIDVVTFTSGSTVRNFIEFIGTEEYKILLKGIKLACISPVTADSVKKYGMDVDIVPERFTIEDLAEALAGFYQGKKEEVRG